MNIRKFALSDELIATLTRAIGDMEKISEVGKSMAAAVERMFPNGWFNQGGPDVGNIDIAALTCDQWMGRDQ